MPNTPWAGVVIGLLLLALATVAYAQSPSDGIYLSSNDKSASFVLGQGGTKLFLGQQQNLLIQTARIHSTNNENSQFSVQLTVPYDPNIKPPYSLVLVISERGYVQTGGGSAPGTSEIDFTVTGADNVLEVSRFLNTPVNYHRYPGQLVVSFAPTKPKLRLGEGVAITFRIKNVGTNSVAFFQGGHYRGASRDNQYTFSARFLGKQVEDLGSSIHFGGIGGTRVLKPGEVFQDQVDLRKWFAFDKPGLYEILGSYEMTFVDPDREQDGFIWADYATSSFSLTVEK